MTWAMDPQLVAFINQLTDTSDTILLGRKMTPGFISHWERADQAWTARVRLRAEDGWNPEGRVQQDAASRRRSERAGAQRRHGRGRSGDQAPAGKDIVVYGGATFVASLIEHNLIDELNLFVNPVAIGDGLRVFTGRKPLKLATSTPYPCGIVVSTYRPG